MLWFFLKCFSATAMACCFVAGQTAQGKATALASQAVRFSRRNFRQQQKQQEQSQQSTKQQLSAHSLQVTAAESPRYNLHVGGKGAVSALYVHVMCISNLLLTKACIRHGSSQSVLAASAQSLSSLRSSFAGCTDIDCYIPLSAASTSRL